MRAEIVPDWFEKRRLSLESRPSLSSLVSRAPLFVFLSTQAEAEQEVSSSRVSRQSILRFGAALACGSENASWLFTLQPWGPRYGFVLLNGGEETEAATPGEREVEWCGTLLETGARSLTIVRW